MRSSSFRILVISCVVIALLSLGIVYAVPPLKHHPNLRAAEKLINNAIVKITDAQKANEWDMNGHAAKAKALLDEAKTEVKLAAEAANK
jgi:hypothetical protein